MPEIQYFNVLRKKLPWAVELNKENISALFILINSDKKIPKLDGNTP